MSIQRARVIGFVHAYNLTFSYNTLYGLTGEPITPWEWDRRLSGLVNVNVTSTSFDAYERH